jgi:signal transduction histidine kinase
MEAREAARNEAALKGAHILMVDDEVSSTCLMTNFLNRIGYTQLRSINDSGGAFEAIESFAPDLILLDLNMPKLDGFDILSALRADRQNEQTPVLVLTGDPTATNKRRALAAGATDLLVKPFDASEVSMRIRNLLHARFLRLEIREQNRLLEARVKERTAELERALADLQAVQRHAMQQERLSAFGEMAGGVVHDFSNALMAVIGYSEMLLTNSAARTDEATALDYLRIINTAGRDGAHVVSRLRDFYRPRGAADVLESLNLKEIVTQSIALSKLRAVKRERDRTVSFRIDLKEDITVAGIGAELREVLTNLIFNALDAIPGPGAITVRARQENSGAVLEVIDTGTGMNAEVKERCLEPFYTTKGDHGTGLGLAMVFGIIKRHQGMLEIESEPGEGTTFRIRLPTFASSRDEGSSESRPAVAA